MEYAGAFGSGAVIAWLIAFVWLPRFERTASRPYRYLTISAVGIVGVLALSGMLGGSLGVSAAVLGLLVAATISLKVRRDINIKYGQRSQRCK